MKLPLNQLACMSALLVPVIVVTAVCADVYSRKIILAVATTDPEVAVIPTLSALVNWAAK